ncbi:MAG: hypothetical protein LQ351_003265 [Letrouitia transgressa]|nr:MAG: hypothetical protein LQ351_003265 [Letrouitia transgressa]
MPPSTRSTRKYQTRLTFTPLPSSSPTVPESSEQDQRHVASVRYESFSSPAKKRRMGSSSAIMSASSPASGTPVSVTSSRSKKGHGLQLPTPLPSSQNDPRIEPGKRVLLEAKPDSSKKLLAQELDALSSSSEASTSTLAEQTTPNKIFGRISRISKQPTGQNKRKIHIAGQSISETDSSVPASTSRNGEKTADQGVRDESDIQTPHLRTRKGKPMQKSVGNELSSSEDSDSLPPRSTRRSNLKKIRKRDNVVPEQQAIEKTGDTSDDSLMNELRTPVEKARRKLFLSKYSVFQDENGPIRPITISDHGDDSSDGVIVSRKSRRTKSKTSSLTREKIATEKTIRQKQLELLKRRRSGNKPIELSSDSEGDEVASATHSRNNGEPSEEYEDSDTAAMRQAISTNLDEYEGDFVVDDGENLLGGPADLDDIPIEFTRHAIKKPFEHFKDVAEWMIHNKLNPAFERNDPIYTIAVDRLDKEVQGYSGSKFLSAAWNPTFLNALKRHPELSAIEVSPTLGHSCEACNRSNHPAKHQLTFSGKPYDRISLEEDSSDNDSERDDDDPSRGVFLLGRTCNANAEMAHALYHWRYSLNQYVVDWLRTKGHLSPGKIVERERWSVKKKAIYANKIVDGMVEDGEMRVLFKEFKENLAAARDARNDTYNYGGRFKS